MIIDAFSVSLTVGVIGLIAYGLFSLFDEEKIEDIADKLKF